MIAWTNEELDKIGTEDELDLTSCRGDGTMRDPVTMWVVRIDDDLYVRAYKGRSGPWFRGVLSCHEGHFRSGGIDKDVRFAEADAGINDRIDAAYRTKYGHYERQYVDPMVTPAAREATIKLVPRSTSS